MSKKSILHAYLFISLTLGGLQAAVAQGRAPAAPAAPPAPAAAAETTPPAEARRMTFLGVEAMPVDPALAAQLGLAEGVGLTVRAVVRDTAAAAVLQRHDVLVKLDDQWLTDASQLGTLIRMREPGTTVTLLFRRAGQEQTASIVLGDRPVNSPAERPADWREALEQLPERLRHLGEVMPPGEVQRIMEVVRERTAGALRPGSAPAAPGGPPVPPGPSGAGENVKIVQRDEAGTVELSVRQGEHHLRVLDAAGKALFDGPVTSEEQREALTPEVRARLESLPELKSLEARPGGRLPTGRIYHVTPPVPQTQAPAAPSPAGRMT